MRAFSVAAALATAVQAVALIMLHLLPTGYHPVRDAVSDYGVGRYRGAWQERRLMQAYVDSQPHLGISARLDHYRSVFDGITARIAVDRPTAMKDFLDRSYNVDLLGGDRVSDQAWQNSFYVAISASAHAALSCVTACQEDFRGDLATISIPVLVIHGDQDRVLPCEATSRRLPALLKNARCTVIGGGPHAVIWTHADEVNQALLDFIGHPGQAGTRHSGPENQPPSGSQNGRAD
jgi:pimeloyl-ACP methyl ester carboxylesterase